jgi:hypothetical protein
MGLLSAAISRGADRSFWQRVSRTLEASCCLEFGLARENVRENVMGLSPGEARLPDLPISQAFGAILPLDADG